MMRRENPWPARLDPQGHLDRFARDADLPDPAFHRVPAMAAEYVFGRLPRVADAKLPDEATVARWLLPPAVRTSVQQRPANAPVIPAPQPFEVPPLRTKWWPPPEIGRVFNDLGKLVSQHDDQGRERHWRYDGSGNPVEFTDFDGGRWTYEHGVWHFLTRMVNPLGAAVTCSYTPYGLLASCTDAGGSCSEYSYDLTGQLVEIRRHGGTKERYQRDACGNLVAKYGSDGALLLAIEIGPGNLPVTKRLASGEELSYRYDHLGRPAQAASRRDAIKLAYDDFDNCILEKRNGCGIEARFEQPRGPSELVFAGRFAVGYRRDSSGVLALTDPMGAAQFLRQYSAGLLEQRFSNGSVETCQFDVRGRFLFKCAQRRLANQVWSRRFHWSGEGELRAVEDSAAGHIRFEYDAAHRLRRRHLGGRTEEFWLDAADNLLGQPGLNGVTLFEGNRIRSANGFEFTYSNRQHIETRGTVAGPVRYVHDSRDQLVRAELPDGDWCAEYDAFGRRVRKVWKNRTTEFYWYGDQLIAEVDAEGRLRLYMYADPLAVVPIMFIDYASIDAPPVSGSRYFLFTDQLGAPCLIEDDAGNDVWAATISPYGLAAIAPHSGIEFNLRHPGQYFDTELGLHYNRFRYFDPVLGRYIESDPWGITGGPNLYAYRTNPLLVADVRGLGEEHGPDGKKVPKDEEGNHISPLTGEPVEGSVKVCQKTEDGKVVARYYVDEHGRTVRAEGLLDPPASYKKEGVGHVTPEGYESGRDHRGHLIPERSAASQPAVNVPENVIAEHGTKSNLSEKKRWENGARDHAENNPGTWSVHEPHYDGDNPRPSAATHSLTDSDGNEVPGSSKRIPNPED